MLNAIVRPCGKSISRNVLWNKEFLSSIYEAAILFESNYKDFD
jgi:hypothetical protein